jgi:Rrf2 family protein
MRTALSPLSEEKWMLTKKGKYGLKAMVHLAGRLPGEATLVTEIATANEIPKKFLDTILGELRNAGFVNSKKGKGGGYTLARPAHEIRVGHIIRILDGPLAPIQCASQTSYRRCDDCQDENHCSVRLIMCEARRAIAMVLDNRTLAEMRALTMTDDAQLMYFI